MVTKTVYVASGTVWHNGTMLDQFELIRSESQRDAQAVLNSYISTQLIEGATGTYNKTYDEYKLDHADRTEYLSIRAQVLDIREEAESNVG